MSLRLAVAGALAVALTAAAPAAASYPGANGSLAFVREGAESSSLHALGSDGSLTPFQVDGALEPRYSPDGQRVAYTRVASADDGPELDRDIVIARADGTGATIVAGGPSADGAPSWSPDGTRIAFVRDGELWAMNADGSGKGRLGSGAGGVRRPAWSPDGDRIAFDRVVIGIGEEANRFEIAVLDVRSGLERVLTTAAGDRSPSWAPDGRRIAFATSRNGGSEIYAMNADGSGQRSVTRGQGDDHAPVWSPSGDSIAFLRDNAVMAADAVEGSVRIVAAGESLRGDDGSTLVDLDWQPVPSEKKSGQAQPKAPTAPAPASGRPESLPAPAAAVPASPAVPGNAAGRKASPAPRFSVSGRARRLRGGGRAGALLLPVRCSEACSADLRVYERSRLVGRARATLAAGRSRSVRLSLRRPLRRNTKTLSLRARVTASGDGAVPHVRRVRLR